MEEMRKVEEMDETEQMTAYKGLKLILPSPEWADEIRDFRREFIESGSSMDGQGPLRRMEDPLAWITWSRAQEKREGGYSDLLPEGKYRQ